MQLEHPALLYADTQDFLSFMVPYVRGGLEENEVVFVAARGDNVEALRSEIGDDAGARWADTTSWHPHTGTRLRAFHELVTDELAAGAKHVRLAGEPVWPDGPPELIREWQRYESVLNHVLAPYPVSLVCLYDAARLDPSIVATARRTHPVVRQGLKEGPSRDFEPPEVFVRTWGFDPTPPPPSAARMSGVVDLSSARRFLTDEALRAGLTDDQAMDLCLAANETLTNALVHGRGVASFWTWIEPDGRFVCQVEDHGDGLDDPLVSYRPPSADASSGRGLWMARQLVDLVQILPGSPGTTVRLHVHPGVHRAA